MKVDNFIKSILQLGVISKDDIISSISERIGTIRLRDYDALVSYCKKAQIDIKSFFSSIYMNANEDVQYRMWLDGYVSVCPADRLIKDIESENADIARLIQEDYERDLPHCKAYFENIQDVIIDHISHASYSLKIAMAWFTNPQIFNALLRACKRDVDVHLLINNDAINNRSNGLPFNKLIEEEAKLYIAETPDLIHNKFCIVDNKIVIDGSYNWTVLAETNNDENIVVIENGKVIKSFISAFENLIKNRKVDEMPHTVPQKTDYECCSYSDYYNSEEWLIQAKNAGKKKRHELYKAVYRALPENLATDKIPSDYFDSVKEEVDEERTRDERLFRNSIERKTEELQRNLTNNEQKIEAFSQNIIAMTENKSVVIEKYKSQIETIKAKRLSQSQKENQLFELRKSHKQELNRINRAINKQNEDIASLKSDSQSLLDQKDFINSIKDIDLLGSNGLFRINLKWDTKDDLDLHLLLPDGVIGGKDDIYYSNKQVEYMGGRCFLDHDAIPANGDLNPQENIIWENKLPDGEYDVKVKLYSKQSNLSRIPFSVTVFAGKYVEPAVFYFDNPIEKQVIDIATVKFKNGKVVTPIKFK